VTATLILETLAKEFSIRVEAVRSAFEMIDAGLSSPFIGRFRRAQTGALSETQIRRLQNRRLELDELDRRRGTMQRTLERMASVDSSSLKPILSCTDRFELEDHFVPHRRPEPEVQLALDRGLGQLADLLVKPVPRSDRPQAESATQEPAADSDGAAPEGVADVAASEPGASQDPSTASTENPDAPEAGAETASPEAVVETIQAPTEAPAEAVAEAPAATTADAPAEAPAATSADAPADASTAASADAPAEAPAAAPTETPVEVPTFAPAAKADVAQETAHVSGLPGRIKISPDLARMCTPFVNPDKGIHTEAEALAGAVRILSDRLGRSSHLRGLIRRMVRKRGVLHVRPLVDDSKAGRHRSLFKMKQPLRQVQGHRLIALRQAQKERVLNTVIVLDPEIALAKVRVALGKHTEPACDSLLKEVARQSLEARLLPLAEADIRLELKERSDSEALRFLSQHLRQILLSPPLGPQPVVAVDVNARGDWVVCILGPDGEPISVHKIDTRVAAPIPAAPAAPAADAPAADAPAADAPATTTDIPPSVAKDVTVAASADESAPVEAAAPAEASALAETVEGAADAAAPAQAEESATAADVPASAEPAPAPKPQRRKSSRPKPPVRKDAATLGAELAAILGPNGPHALAVGHGKGPRAAVPPLRAALAAADLNVCVTIVNESGLSSYANSELGRKELSGYSVPERLAISLGRRLQNPMAEILKVDPRHLGLGAEQGLVSKANLRRMFTETLESCVAHVGCDVNSAPLSMLKNLPGLDEAAAQKIIEARATKPFQDREELRTDGLLTEAQWTSAIAFLRITGGPNRLDGTGLHPEMYDLAAQLLDSVGGSVQESLGRPGVTKGLRRASFDVDEATWRDVMRELAQPGADPRPSLFRPDLLGPDTDRAGLTVGRVVEGIVTNVASFGAFVDIGLPQDGMIHISQVSSRYVRDARELLSIGQSLRTRVLDPSAQRVALTIKDVGDPRRPSQRPPERRPGGKGRGQGARGEGGRGRGQGGRGARPDRGPKVDPNLRAAQERRDGLGVRATRTARGGPGGRGGRGGDRRPGREDRGERVNLGGLNAEANQGTAFNPFANFFKGRDGEGEPEPVAKPAPKPEEAPKDDAGAVEDSSPTPTE